MENRDSSIIDPPSSTRIFMNSPHHRGRWRHRRARRSAPPHRAEQGKISRYRSGAARSIRSTWRGHRYGARRRFSRRSRSGFLYHRKALGASFMRALRPHLTPGINPSGVSKNLRRPQRQVGTLFRKVFSCLRPRASGPSCRRRFSHGPVNCRMAAEIFLPRGAANGDESLGAFVRRRFGAEALDRVAQPLVGGIYAADPDKLSLSATMPRFKEMERAHRSIILSMVSEQRRRARNRETGSGARWSLFVTLAGGMQELVDRIVKPASRGMCALEYSNRTDLIRDTDKNLGRLRPAGTKALKWTLSFSQLLRSKPPICLATLPADRCRCFEADHLRIHGNGEPRLPTKRFPTPARQLRLRRTGHRVEKNHGLHFQQFEISRQSAGRSCIAARLRRRQFAA